MMTTNSMHTMDDNISDESDGSVIGYDPADQLWIIANKTKKNARKRSNEAHLSNAGKTTIETKTRFTRQDNKMNIICKGSKNKKCNEDIEDENATCCTICEEWYHVKCQLASQEAFKFLSRFQEPTGISWICEFCRCELPKLRKAREQEMNLPKRVKMLEETVTKQMSDIANQLRKNAATRAKSNEKSEKAMHKIGEEIATVCQKMATQDVVKKCMNDLKEAMQEKVELYDSRTSIVKAEKAIKDCLKNEREIQLCEQGKKMKEVCDAMDSVAKTLIGQKEAVAEIGEMVKKQLNEGS